MAGRYRAPPATERASTGRWRIPAVPPPLGCAFFYFEAERAEDLLLGKFAETSRAPPRRRGDRGIGGDGDRVAMSVRKIPDSERWKRRRPRRLKAPFALTPIAPSPAPAPLINESQAKAERARIARWVAAQIVNYPPDRCLRCRRPIVYGAKWLELVNDNERARFHFDCAPVWRAQQEVAARQAMGLDQSERP